MNLKNTTLIIIGIILIALLLIISTFVKQKPSTYQEGLPNQITSAPDPRDGWNRYTDTSGMWAIDTPSTTRIIVDKQVMASIGYIPTCDSTTALVCILIDKNIVPNSNFQGAAVSVNIVSATSSSACLSKKTAEQTELGITMINTIPFQTFTASNAAMSHQSSGANYRTWNENTCYGIETSINTTSFEVYEAGTVKKFTDTDRAQIENLLNDSVSSFRFKH